MISSTSLPGHLWGKRLLVSAVSLASVAALVGVNGPVAEATPAAEIEPLETIEDVAPEVFEDEAYYDEQDDGEMVVNLDGSLLGSIPDSSDGELSFGGLTEEPLTLSLPFSDQASPLQEDGGRIFFDNNNGTATVPVAKTDGSLQIVTTIEDSSSPTEFKYELGEEVDSIAIDGDGNAIFTDVDGGFVGGSLPAWAYDAEGTPVPTHYRVEGASLTQIVEHTASTFVYPVVADPYLGRNLFSRTWRSTYNGADAGRGDN